MIEIMTDKELLLFSMAIGTAAALLFFFIMGVPVELPSAAASSLSLSLPHPCKDDHGVVCQETQIRPAGNITSPMILPPLMPPFPNQSQYNPPPPNYNCPPGGNSTANGTLWGCVIKQTDSSTNNSSSNGPSSYLIHNATNVVPCGYTYNPDALCVSHSQMKVKPGAIRCKDNPNVICYPPHNYTQNYKPTIVPPLVTPI